MSAELTDAENMVIGAIASIFTVGALQPTIYMKNAMAQGMKPSLDPSVLYRGVGVNLGSSLKVSVEFATDILRNCIRRNKKHLTKNGKSYL